METHVSHHRLTSIFFPFFFFISLHIFWVEIVDGMPLDYLDIWHKVLYTVGFPGSVSWTATADISVNQKEPRGCGGVHWGSAVIGRVAFQNRWRGNAAFTRRRRQVNKRNYPQTQHSRSFLHAACIVTTLITRTQRNYHSWISPWSYQVRGSLGIFHDVGHTTIARFFVRQGTAPAASSNPSGLAPPPTHPWGKGSARMFSRLIVFP